MSRTATENDPANLQRMTEAVLPFPLPCDRRYPLLVVNIAILHYHLRSGGVSSVLRAQADALTRFSSSDRVVILSGMQPAAPMPVPVLVVPGLDYAGRTTANPEGAAASLAQEIDRALDRAFAGPCDLLHVHNPLIRKNAAFLEALIMLQRRGQRLLIQVHDLAEDFRPDVYHDRVEYPGSCAYAVINSRDRERLASSGLGLRHVHLLPNPVPVPPSFEARSGYREEAQRGRRTALYPVRAIRRKNVGECLLLARFLPEGAELAVTLPPTSSRDKAVYASWKSVAAEERLRVRFEAGLEEQLSSLYDASFCVVTTSVKEGFGYSYLDPIARGIPVVGREIPYVVADFRAEGIALAGLYREIRVPRSAIPAEALHDALALRIESFRRAYAPSFAPEGRAGFRRFEEILAALGRRFEGEYVDFGALDEGSQAHLLRRLDADAALEQDLGALNPFLSALFESACSPERAEAERKALRAAYSEEAYAELLRGAYRDAVSDEAAGSIDRRVLLQGYLTPESFFMVAS